MLVRPLILLQRNIARGPRPNGKQRPAAPDARGQGILEQAALRRRDRWAAGVRALGQEEDLRLGLGGKRGQLRREPAAKGGHAVPARPYRFSRVGDRPLSHEERPGKEKEQRPTRGVILAAGLRGVTRQHPERARG